jgi:hypothetical protein
MFQFFILLEVAHVGYLVKAVFIWHSGLFVERWQGMKPRAVPGRTSNGYTAG